MSTAMNINHNLLNINKNAMAPYIIAAFSMVYGVDFHSLIKAKVNNTLLLQYVDVQGIQDYTDYLKNCKSKELAVKFLVRLGYKVANQNELNFANDFDCNLENLINCYLGEAGSAFNRKENSPTLPFRLLKYEEKCSNVDIKNKVRLINQIRGNAKEPITEDTLKDFEATKEYQTFLRMTLIFEMIYQELLTEFKKWEKSLINYEEFIQTERERKLLIFQEKGFELYKEIFNSFPDDLKLKLKNKSFLEQINVIFGSMTIESKTIIEAFSRENMKRLYDDDVPLYEKYWIVAEQKPFFDKVGIVISNERILGCSCLDDVHEYLTFLNQPEVKNLLPNYDILENLTILRKKKFENALEEYYCTSEEFLKVTESFSDDEETKQYFLQIFKNRRVCTSVCRKDNSYAPILCYTVRPSDGGSLAYALIHEFGHIIDYNEYGSGFESVEDLESNGKVNPYNDAYRYYERFNETVNDMFALEVINILNSNDIYLLEEKKISSLYLENNNTSKIVKDLIKPLLDKYKIYVIKAKITSNKEYLTEHVGRDNFEELVDAVNKVDFLVSKGLIRILEASEDSPIVQEYYNQLERVEEIYKKIEEYSRSKSNNYHKATVMKKRTSSMAN